MANVIDLWQQKFLFFVQKLYYIEFNSRKNTFNLQLL